MKMHDFTPASRMDENLRIAGEKLLAASLDFWQVSHETGRLGAVQWLEGLNGELLIYTRGEYRQQLFKNIESLAKEKSLENEQERKVAEERERCAKLCDSMEALSYAMYRGKVVDPLGGHLTPGHPYLEGSGDGAGSCALAIRALKSQQHSSNPVDAP